MPLHILAAVGDGLVQDRIRVQVTLPDSGQSIAFAGTIQQVLTSLEKPLSGSPLSAPVVPGSSFTGWILQGNASSGAATVKTASGAMPTADAGNIIFFQGQVASTDPATMVNGSANNIVPSTTQT